MKTVLDQKSYWIGVVVGVMGGAALGMWFGLYLAVSKGLLDLAYRDDVSVRQGVVILEKLETQDVARTKHFLNTCVALDYLRQHRRQDSWFIRKLYPDQDITQFVNRNLSRLPDLAQEIERQERQPTGASTVRGAAPP